ncbi:Uncharacterized protein FWK35_00026018 [Aphis craccivora]|uniref:Uncharacterized protein n=1 Tax=Aphis craccivora TaxID=307492 RepID=A0A6G0WIJ9_APHCR|nr:Uncharacterized protein FWK35_00026018 [Aphis craccivora]
MEELIKNFFLSYNHRYKKNRFGRKLVLRKNSRFSLIFFLGFFSSFLKTIGNFLLLTPQKISWMPFPKFFNVKHLMALYGRLRASNLLLYSSVVLKEHDTLILYCHCQICGQSLLAEIRPYELDNFVVFGMD